MFLHEVVELREGAVRNTYLTPTEKADGGVKVVNLVRNKLKKKKTVIHMQDLHVEYIPAYYCRDS